MHYGNYMSVVIGEAPLFRKIMIVVIFTIKTVFVKLYFNIIKKHKL